MSSIIHKELTLCLNKHWAPIDIKTVGKAICDMMAGCGNEPPYMGMSITYPQNPDGTYDFNSPEYEPVYWEQWLELPIREYDLVVHTARRAIRAPTVIVAANYGKMPIKRPKPTNENIRLRDNSTCQISGKKLSKGRGDIDHCTPKSRGGKDTWENKIFIDKELNRLKGARTLEEMGWQTIRVPRALPSITIAATIRKAAHRDWSNFLIVKE